MFAVDAMHAPVICLEEMETVGHIHRMLSTCSHNGFPVITKVGRNYVGMVLRNQLVVLLRKRLQPEDSFSSPGGTRTRALSNGWAATGVDKGWAAVGVDTAGPTTPQMRPRSGSSVGGMHSWQSSGREGHFAEDYRLISEDTGSVERLDAPLPDAAAADISPLDFTTSLSSTIESHEDLVFSDGEAGLLIDLRPFMNPGPISVQEITPMTRVFRLFRGLGLRHLTVVNEKNQPQGIITRKELEVDHHQD